jgi:hypothetical protein
MKAEGRLAICTPKWRATRLSRVGFSKGQSLEPVTTALCSSVGHALACHGEPGSPWLFLDKLKHVLPRAQCRYAPWTVI